MWSEIIAIYRASKKRVDINWWTEWICRPIAALFVYLIRNTRITPNQITFLSVFVCAIAAGLFAFVPSYLGLLGATLVLEASFVLDCADGQLARIRNTSSPLGHLLDFLMDEIKAMLIFASVTLRLWNATQETLYLLIGLGALFALASGMRITSFTRRPEYGAKPPSKDGQPATIHRRRGPVGSLVTYAEHFSRLIIHYPAYIWALAIVNRIDIYFWAYATVGTVYFVRIFSAQVLRLGRTHEHSAS